MKVIIKLFRIFVTCVSTIVMIVICTFFYARFVEPNMLVEEHIKISNERATKPFRIIFFSDTHFGEMYPEKNIEKLVKKINAQKPDIVVFGGDFLDNYYKEKATINLEYIAEQLAKIEASYAKYAVWGNHDFGGGSSRIYGEMMENGGFILLQNESNIIEELNLEIRGIDDYLLGNPDTSTEMLKEDRINILISHAPDIIDEMEGSKVDIMLAGHSHGGQVLLPKATEYILPIGAKKYSRGIYLFKNQRDSKLYVTKGVGVTKVPYRFLTIPEIVVVDIE